MFLTPPAKIIGGGPAGTAAACDLARAGHAVTLYERDATPAHKVCGDFLSAEAQRSLAALGVDPAALGAVPIHTVRLVHGMRVAVARLPFAALGLTRRALDRALLERAAALGADVRLGSPVREAPESDGPVVIATGKHGLRGVARPGGTGVVGLKMYYALAPVQAAALAGHVEIIPFSGGYAGLNAVEGGLANLCLLVAKPRVRDGWDALLDGLFAECPHLAVRLAGARADLAKPLAIGNIPYGFVHRANDGDRAYRVGDQAAVIGSFSGDGVSIALHSGRLAAAHIVAGATPAAYHAALRDGVGAQVARAQLLHRLFGTSWGAWAAVTASRLVPAIARAGAALTRIPGRVELPSPL